MAFRVETRQRARSLGVAGWVRNCADGTVEAVFEGEEEQVGSMIEWCRRGPRGARVEALEVAREAAAGETGFAIL